LADISSVGRWAAPDAPSPSPSPTITRSIRAGTLDAELAATIWLLLEGRVPLLVAAGAAGTGRRSLLSALLDLVPPNVRAIEVSGEDETYAWLPQAGELGWRRTPAADAPVDLAAGAAAPSPDFPVRPDRAMLVVPDLVGSARSTAWGEVGRVAVRAATIGYGFAATMDGDTLEQVLASLRRPPLGVTDDESSRLGMVLILRSGPDGAARVTASHYIRPVARDEHGHVQRLGPAVLATWDEGRDRFEHFGWGITPELARRVGRRAGDFELEVARRALALDALARDEVVDRDAVRAALQTIRSSTDPSPMPS
jgi:hypothetical protein